jgi:hypothetical protein
MDGRSVVRWARSVVVGLGGLAVLAAAGTVPAVAAAPAAPAAVPPPAVAITTTPALQPAFDPTVPDYVSRCSTAAPVTVSVVAPAGTAVSVDGAEPRTGTFSVVVRRDVGQSFRIATYSAAGVSTHVVRCLPPDFPAVTATRTGAAQSEFVMVSAIATTSFGAPPAPLTNKYVAVVDGNGVPVWWFDTSGLNPPNVPATDFDRLPDGNFAFTYGGQGGGPVTPGGSFEIDLAGRVVRAMNAVGASQDGHELQVLPDGNFLIDAYPLRTGVDLRAIGGSADATIEDAEIQEVTPGGALVWKWDAFDHVPVTELEPSLWPEMAASPTADIYHLNALTYDAATGNVVTSLRHESGIYEISRTTGAIVWKLGGSLRAESLAIVGDPSGRPVGEHDIRMTADGQLTMFDNGAERAGNQFHPPRGVRYGIDPGAHTATFLEQITDPAVTTSTCCGSARRLDGGNWVIGWGQNDRVTETQPGGVPVTTLSFAGDLFPYRAIPLVPGTVSRDALRNGMDAQHPSGTISVGSVALRRGDSGSARLAVFPVTLSQPSTRPVTVNYVIGPDGTSQSASSPSDFAPVVGTVAFIPDASGLTPTVQYVATTVYPNPLVTATRSFAVTLTGPTGGYQIDHGTSGGALLGDPWPVAPLVSVGDALIWDGISGDARLVMVPVTLSRPAAGTVSVTLTTGGGTAVAGVDYLAPPTTTVTFAPGQTEQFAYVAALSRPVPGLAATVGLGLSNPQGGVALGKAAGAVIIG